MPPKPPLGSEVLGSIRSWWNAFGSRPKQGLDGPGEHGEQDQQDDDDAAGDGDLVPLEAHPGDLPSERPSICSLGALVEHSLRLRLGLRPGGLDRCGHRPSCLPVPTVPTVPVRPARIAVRSAAAVLPGGSGGPRDGVLLAETLAPDPNPSARESSTRLRSPARPDGKVCVTVMRSEGFRYPDNAERFRLPPPLFSAGNAGSRTRDAPVGRT